MTSKFHIATSFDSDLSKWDVSKVVITITHLRKIFEKSCGEIWKWSRRDHGHFWVHRDQFSVDFDVRGLCARLRHCIRSFQVIKGRIRCQKIVSFEYLRVQDPRANTDFWSVTGTPGTKIVSKSGLAWSKRTSFGRIVRVEFNTVDIEPKNVSKLRILGEISSIFDLESTQEIQDFTRNFWWCHVSTTTTCVSTGVAPTPSWTIFLHYSYNNGEDSEITSKKPSKSRSHEFSP